MPRLNRLLAGAVLALSATTAFAADDAMTVHFKQSRRVQLSGQAANVVIGDPAVADVAMLDSHSVLVLGKGFGTTDILVLDRSGRPVLGPWTPPAAGSFPQARESAANSRLNLPV